MDASRVRILACFSLAANPATALGGALMRGGRFFAPIREARGVPRWVLWAGIVITLVFVVLALFAPMISPYGFDEYRTGTGERFGKQQHPSADHLFGTNVLGTDVLARVIFGARTALEV